MFGLIRTAVRFFFIGLGVGLLLAPRKGEETRQLIREKVNEALDSVLEIADLPEVEANGANGGSRARGRTRRSEANASASD
jgi:gas vesicle protein